MKERRKTIFVMIRFNPKHKFQEAFTFIELFFVIIIIGVLIGVSIPSFRNTSNQMRLNNFSRELQSSMNYFCERSIIERKIIYLTVDNEKKQCWAQVMDSRAKLKTIEIPEDIEVEVKKEDNSVDGGVIFYPDGSIEKVTLNIKSSSLGYQKVGLTTEGVFGRVKMRE